MRDMRSRGWAWLGAGVFALLLAACSPPEPIRLGFLGGLTGPNSDNGQAGLQGVNLAIEQFNRAGGAQGRLVELVVRDDGQNAAQAAQGAAELVQAGVVAVIGPFTSSMTAASLPVTARQNLLQVSPTITSMDFYGKDDNLFRINRTTRDNARDYARQMAAQGQRRIAVAYDLGNRSFTESWLKEFRAAVAEHGGEVVAAESYTGGTEWDAPALMSRLLRARPDGLLFISGALDVARLAQQARRQAPTLPIAASEWAATEYLVEFGGEVVEGLLIAQNYDRDDTSERFRAFVDAYHQRFRRQPGYSSVAAYDAATVVLQALAQQQPGEPLKAALRRLSPFQGLQQPIRFDANGDTPRQVYFTEIRGGRYVQLAGGMGPAGSMEGARTSDNRAP